MPLLPPVTSVTRAGVFAGEVMLSILKEPPASPRRPDARAPLGRAGQPAHDEAPLLVDHFVRGELAARLVPARGPVGNGDDGERRYGGVHVRTERAFTLSRDDHRPDP